MTKLVEYETQLCSIRYSIELRGVYIGSVLTTKGERLFVVERPNGQVFVGVKATLAVITPVTTP